MKKALIYLLFIFCYTNTTHAQDYDIEMFCAKIKTTKDKINGSLSYKSPQSNPIVFSRYPKKDSYFYMIQLRKVTKYKSSGYGVTVEFENGDKIERHLKVAIRINDETQFEHFINFKLEPRDIKLFKNELVKEISLHQLTFTVSNPKKYKAYIECIEGK